MLAITRLLLIELEVNYRNPETVLFTIDIDIDIYR